jgi:Phosphodiester glycosidase
VTWWESGRAPAVWRGPDAAVAAAVAWRPAAAGMAWGELTLAGSGEAWRLLAVLVRLDPARVRLELVRSSREGGTLAAWSLDDLPEGAAFAVNAGQFTGGAPWGWLVRRGELEQRAGAGPLAVAVAVLGDGRVGFLPAAAIPPSGTGGAREAFQSYPALLSGDGEVPRPLRRAGLGVDVEHRDARLAVGELRDGGLLVALTRFAAAGDALGSLPFGPTVPEMAALMGALGCRRAVALDGGISAQLALRDGDGTLRSWRGWRQVPLALVAYPRDAAPR